MRDENPTRASSCGRERFVTLVREKLARLCEALLADVGRGRLALGSLLGRERLCIQADGRIEATATPGRLSAPRSPSERIAQVVAGAGFEPATCGL
jgi:hypothetical protein